MQSALHRAITAYQRPGHRPVGLQQRERLPAERADDIGQRGDEPGGG